jgi:cytochrome c oxidase subunit 3
MRRRIAADVSDLPTYGFGAVSHVWWGTMAFVALEGMGFAIGIGTYLYLAFINPVWPLDNPPDLLPSTVLTVLLLASAVPNWILDRKAQAEDLRGVRIWLTAMSVIGIVLVAIRAYEFYSLNTRWDSNAYGSILWFLLGLHTTHLVTDLGDTVVLNVLMFTKHARGRRFSDVSDNAFYWYFVLAVWVPLYVLIYWVPRL